MTEFLPPADFAARSGFPESLIRTLARDDRLHALWVVLLTTGLREAEALALTWEDVDLGVANGNRVAQQGGGNGGPEGDDGVHRGRVHRRRRGRGGDLREGLRDGLRGAGPSLRVHHTLHRIDGEWQRRDPKTPKSRRTVMLPADTADALRRHKAQQLVRKRASAMQAAMGSKA